MITFSIEYVGGIKMIKNKYILLTYIALGTLTCQAMEGPVQADAGNQHYARPKGHNVASGPQKPMSDQELSSESLYKRAMQHTDDDATFVKLILQATRKKDPYPDALYEAGQLFANGTRGVEPNMSEAVRLWRLAGDHVGSKYCLAQTFEEHHMGVPKDEKEALHLYEEVMGPFFRTVALIQRQDFVHNELIDEWKDFRRAAAKRAASFYIDKSGQSWIIERGWALYRELEKLGDPDLLYYFGSKSAVNNNDKNATLYGLNQLQQAGKQDHVEALFALGNIHKDGLSNDRHDYVQYVVPDLGKARDYYLRVLELDPDHVRAYNGLLAIQGK